MTDLFHAGISGARGRMGRAVDLALDAREDVVVAVRFDWGETPDLSLCDVIIDFSTAEASVALARTCAERAGPALVIGSTGFTPEQDTEIQAAADKGCDLIFMASHGRRGISALLLGSETMKVLTHSKIPVLVCR